MTIRLVVMKACNSRISAANVVNVRFSVLLLLLESNKSLDSRETCRVAKDGLRMCPLLGTWTALIVPDDGASSPSVDPVNASPHKKSQPMPHPSSLMGDNRLTRCL